MNPLAFGLPPELIHQMMQLPPSRGVGKLSPGQIPNGALTSPLAPMPQLLSPQMPQGGGDNHRLMMALAQSSLNPLLQPQAPPVGPSSLSTVSHPAQVQPLQRTQLTSAYGRGADLLGGVFA